MNEALLRRKFISFKMKVERSGNSGKMDLSLIKKNRIFQSFEVELINSNHGIIKYSNRKPESTVICQSQRAADPKNQKS